MTFSENHLDNFFDSKFAQIEDLQWYPFVGINYRTAPKKILIIAESHYGEKGMSYEDPLYLEELKEWSASNSTCQCIIEERYNGDWYNKTYANITSLLSGERYALPENIWDHIAFYNLIQELLPNIQFRPSYEQYQKGVDLLPRIIEILTPDLCIVIGVGARYIFSTQYESYRELSYKIGNSYPFQLKIGSTPIIAFPHISRTGFNGIEKYRDALRAELPFSKNILHFLCMQTSSSLTAEERKMIFLGPDFRRILEELLYQYDFLESIIEENEHDGTPYFGFNVKNEDFRIAFNFWEADFKGLTVGMHFPNGVPEKQKPQLKEIFKKSDGWNNFPHWIFYDLFRLYNWNDTVFEGIKDGSIRIIFQKVLDNFEKVLKDNHLI